MKIFHLADIHTSAKTLEQVKRCTGFVTEQAAIHQPALTIIAGDIFDSRDIRLDSEPVRYIFSWVRQMSDYSPVFIVKGTPTHEGNAIKPLEMVGKRFPVYVADYPGMYILTAAHSIKPIADREPSDCGVRALISAMPTPTKQFMQAGDDDLASALTPIFAGFGAQAAQYEDVPHIHVGHYCVRGASISEDQTMVGRDIEIGRDQIELANPDIVCLGHIHLHQEVEPGMFYSGALIKKDHGEYDDKGFYIYDLSMAKGNPKFIQTPSDRLLRIREDFTVDGNTFIDADMVLHTYGPDELKGAILKVEFTFWQDEGLEHTRESIEKFFEPCDCQSVDVQIIRKPRENIRSQEILKAESLSEKVQLLADQNKEEITPGIQDKCNMLETMTQEECIKVLNEPVVIGVDPAGEDTENTVEYTLVHGGPVKVEWSGPKQQSLFEVKS